MGIKEHRESIENKIKELQKELEGLNIPTCVAAGQVYNVRGVKRMVAALGGGDIAKIGLTNVDTMPGCYDKRILEDRTTATLLKERLIELGAVYLGEFNEIFCCKG